MKVKKYPLIPKKVFKFTWYRKPPPACLAALPIKKNAVEERRYQKAKNRKLKLENRKKSDKSKNVVICQFSLA